MIKKFEPEKYYRFVGDVEGAVWSSPMTVVLDHKPRRCIGVGASNMPNGAVFEGVGREYIYYWGDNLTGWEEYASDELDYLNKQVDEAMRAVNVYYDRHPEKDPRRRIC